MTKNYFEVKTIFPVDTNVTKNHESTIKKTDYAYGVKLVEVVNMYNKYREADYKVSVSFTAPAKKDESSDQEFATPFDVGHALSKEGVDYHACLKLKTKGSYEDMLDVMHLIEAEGFDLIVNIELKINENTDLNVDNVKSWTNEDAIYKITPKASSNNVDELKSLYDELNDKGYEADISIKPAAPKKDDMGEENNTLANQLAAYPEGTLVTFRLSEEKE